MMEMDESVDLTALARVWERVGPPAQGPDTAPEDRLRAELARLIRNASAAGKMYDLLAMKTRGSHAELTFRRLSREEADSERKLQTEFFLLTGDTFAAPSVHPSAPGVAGAVREACLAEEKNSRRLEALRGLAGDDRAASLFRELAARERSHAALLRQLLERMI